MSRGGGSLDLSWIHTCGEGEREPDPSYSMSWRWISGSLLDTYGISLGYMCRKENESLIHRTQCPGGGSLDLSWIHVEDGEQESSDRIQCPGGGSLDLS